MAKRDLYREITDKVLATMETAGMDWVMPFNRQGGIPRNPVTGKNYRGINVVLLTLYGNSPSQQFASYKQWQTIGGQVRKGERGKQIVFFKQMTVTKEDKHGEEYEEHIPLLRHFTVFAREQVDGLDTEPATDDAGDVESLPSVDDYLARTQAWIMYRHGKGAYYAPGPDYIILPPKESFSATATSTATENFYSTALHELTHWTGHKDRLDRLSDRSERGYAFEELIAELGAAFQCCMLGVSQEPREDHAKYLNNWMKALRDDSRYLFKAASRAQEAVDYIQELQAQESAPAA